jgi:adenosylcobinamide-phosphate guanylyltransferase
MLALIMAGGEGSRLCMGEKPLVNVSGSPMIAHVIQAFHESGCKVVVVASGKTPMTQNWCRATGIDLFQAPGEGYIEDMVTAVTSLDEAAPLFVSVSDLPCLTPEIVNVIHDSYDASGKDACSTWVPVSLVKNNREIRYVELIDGIEACPAGVNIIRGDIIDRQQDEYRLLLQEPRLAFNVNTRADLEFTNLFFHNHPTGSVNRSDPVKGVMRQKPAIDSDN